MAFRESDLTAAAARSWRSPSSALASKMANSIDTNKKLQDTYLPNQAAVVNLADEARERGRSVMREAANTSGSKK